MRSCSAVDEAGRGRPKMCPGGVISLYPRVCGSRMLIDLALPGDGGGIDFGGDDAAMPVCGEAFDLFSSLPPNIDDIDIPPAGLCDENDARSRAPAKGDAVGGPRGADPGSVDIAEGSWVGEGGGIWRAWRA